MYCLDKFKEHLKSLFRSLNLNIQAETDSVCSLKTKCPGQTKSINPLMAGVKAMQKALITWELSSLYRIIKLLYAVPNSNITK